MGDIKQRTIAFTATADGRFEPAIPQYGGVKGDHNATTVQFTLHSGAEYTEDDTVRIAFVAGDGTVLSSDIIEDVANNGGRAMVEYTLPRAVTQAGGQLEIRLVFSRFDENGHETVVMQYGDAVLYFEDAAVEQHTPFWMGVSEMLKRTVSAMISASAAASAASASEANAAQDRQASQTAATQIQDAAQEASDAAERAQTASSSAAQQAKIALTLCKNAQTAEQSAKEHADLTSQSVQDNEALCSRINQTAGEISGVLDNTVATVTGQADEARTASQQAQAHAQAAQESAAFSESERNYSQYFSQISQRYATAATDAAERAEASVGKDGYTPVRGVDYWTTQDQATMEDYARQAAVEELAMYNQTTVAYAATIDDCTDVTKLYVLPDGYLYAYGFHHVQGGVARFTNLADPSDDMWQTGMFYNADSVAAPSTKENAFISNLIPCRKGDVIRIKNVTDFEDVMVRLRAYDASGNPLGSNAYYLTKTFDGYGFKSSAGAVQTLDDGTLVHTIMSYHSAANQFAVPSYIDSVAAVRIGGMASSMEDVIITVNEEITYTQMAEGDQWYNTGVRVVTDGYAERVSALEDKVAALEAAAQG